jgi:hypothetical protein
MFVKKMKKKAKKKEKQKKKGGGEKLYINVRARVFNVGLLARSLLASSRSCNRLLQIMYS